MRSKVRSVSLPLLATVLMLCAPGTAAQAQTDEPGWLGVSIQDVTEELSQALPRGVHEGAMINRVVEGSPAEAAGLAEGDIVVKVGRTRVKSTGDLTKAVRDIGAGNSAVIEYYRDGRRMRTTAELTERSGEYDKAKNMYKGDLKRRYKDVKRYGRDRDPDLLFFDENPGPLAWTYALHANRPRLGVHLMDLNEQLAEFFKVSEAEGVLVTEVVEESAAEAAGIKAGDVIVSIGDESVADSDDLREELRAYRKGGELSVGIVRNGRRQTIAVELEEVEEPDYKAWTMPRGKSHLAPDLDDFHFEFDTNEFREQMDDLRQELREMRRELEELRRDRP